MRITILSALIMLTGFANAKNYYVAANGNDANSGTSASAPWKTITKVNSAMSSIAAGDSILFNCGDIFYGSINLTKSGTSGKNIVFGKYGTGAKPVISGFTTVTGWTNAGGNIYTKTIYAKKTVNLLIKNNEVQQIARYPNTGWLTYSSGTTTSLTSTTAPGAWVGAELVKKVQDWDNERSTITAISGNTISHSSGSYSGKANYGYFVQRSAAFLDVAGEWYYNGSTLSIYGDPSASTIKISTLDTGLYIGSRSYVTVENLGFEGFNAYGVYSNYSGGNVTVQRCDFNFMGMSGCTLFQTPSATITGCTTNNCLGNALFIRNEGSGGVSGSSITNCYVHNTCQLGGMEISGDKSGRAGITATGGTNVTITGNTVISSGYAGIEWKGSNCLVKNNFVDTFCNRRQDGGGIYAYNSNGTPSTWSNNIIRGNIVINGVGSNDGCGTAPPKARGIYCDEGVNHVLVDDNTIAFNADAGLYCNSITDITFNTNTVYKNKSTLQINRFKGAPLIRNINYKKNILMPYNFSYFNDGIDLPSLITVQTDIMAAGPIDSSYYFTDVSSPVSLGSRYNDNSNYKTTAYAFSYWQGTTAKEKSSIPTFKSTDVLRFEYNATNNAKTIALDGTYMGVDNTVYAGSLTLQPYTSRVMIKTSSAAASNLLVTINAPSIACYGDKSNVTITATGGTAPYTGTGTFSVSAGTYTYTIKDSKGVSLDTTVTVTQPAKALTVTATAGTINTYGGTTTVNVTATGGTPAYSGTGSFTVTAGTYTYTVKDANGCSANTSVTITQPAASTYNLATTNSPSAGGSVSSSPNATSYTSGALVTLTATPASGYTFAGWSGDVTGTASSVTVTMNANKSVIANYQPVSNSYSINTSASPIAGGSVSKSPNATSYTSGTNVTLTATPASGYVFTGWSGDITGIATTVTVTMGANKSVTANYQLASYSLTTAANPSAGGSISRSPNASSYSSGTVVTLTATPASGYTFTGWSGDVSGTATTVTVTMGANKSVTANYQLASYSLTTAASPAAGGSVNRSPNAASYTSGTVVTLTATPASGYTFTGWSGDVTSTASSVTVTMGANKSVTANYQLISSSSYSLTTTANPAAGGSVGTNPKAPSYTSGTIVTLTATPASGYTFTGWSGDVTGTATTVTVTMSANKSVTANYQPISYSLTTTANPVAGGSVNRSPNATSYTSGTVVTLTANPANGYEFTGWSGDVSDTATSVTVTMNTNKSVTANYQPVTATARTTTIQIEDDAASSTGLCSFDGIISSNSGADNSKVINLTNSSAKGITWGVNAGSSGDYTLVWRYTNGGSGNSTASQLIVNGVTVIADLTFAKTSGSNVFSTVTATVSLVQGINTIRLETTASKAFADIDWLEITGDNPVASCPAARQSQPTSTPGTNTTGRITPDKNLTVNAYPNPSTSEFTLMLTGGSTERVVITILGTDGRMIYNTYGYSNRKYTFGGNFKAGLYIARVIQGKNIQTIKLVKGG